MPKFVVTQLSFSLKSKIISILIITHQNQSDSKQNHSWFSMTIVRLLTKVDFNYTVRPLQSIHEGDSQVSGIFTPDNLITHFKVLIHGALHVWLLFCGLIFHPEIYIQWKPWSYKLFYKGRKYMSNRKHV